VKKRLELILASSSPRRRELLGRLGREFRVVSPDADEALPEAARPEECAVALAVRKAESVASRFSEGLVIGADTLAAADGKIIGKPDDAEHARQLLRLLSCRPHFVITGICLINAATGERRTAAESTRVIMRPMSEEQIAAYVATGEPLGKAGAYAIQESGDRYVERVEGSFTNVVGLPMELLERLINELEESGP
jgi:septum formation protein